MDLRQIRYFVSVAERGGFAAAGRALGIPKSRLSRRVAELESRLGVRLLNRTTRKLTTTEIGRAFYDHARRVIETLDEAEALIGSFSGKPQGVIRLTAPLGLGRRLVAPLIPPFCTDNPGIEIRLRLSDHLIDLLHEAVDVAIRMAVLRDSAFVVRKIADCPRVLCAAPAYLDAAGEPERPEDLAGHNCLLLRYPRSPEYYWTLQTSDGPRKMMVQGRFDTDDGDVLRDWALAGHGIANRPLYEVTQDLADGRLVEVLPANRPLPAQFGCLAPHRRLQDPKVRMFADHAVRELRPLF